MKSFNHVNAKTVDEAMETLQKYKGKARLIAGGTDLLGALKHNILPGWPEAIINIKTISSLYYIKEDAKGLKIGALTKLSDIAKSRAVREKYRLLAEAAEAVATPQIRNMASIGGNLCQDVRCWYYRYPHQLGGRFLCYLKGGEGCYALTGENQSHSIFGAARVTAPPCSSNCPASIDIPSYLSKIREGDLREAAKILLGANPMPSITGRVCPHFCEQECNRGDFDEAVSVRDVERFVGDYALKNASEITELPRTRTGRRVAVVGSGPAGLTAAYYLAKWGHSVTVFEASSKAGGMMRTCIPDYRLPKDILDAQIEQIQRAGVDIKVNSEIQSVDGLFQQGYEAIFLALGAQRSARMRIKGEKISGVVEGMNFLREVNLGKKVSLGDKVAVLGGGNTAIDSARTALRLGAKEVTVVYRRTKVEMPASPEEVEEALTEGVKIIFLAAPLQISREDGRLKLTCIQVELGEPDASGRRRPMPIKGSEFSLKYDSIIAAVGQTPDIAPQFNLKTSRQNTLQVDADTLATDRQGVWAGGDVVTGPATVIAAIASGRKAAASIDRYLKGTAAEPEDKGKKTAEPFLRFNSDYLERTSRTPTPKLPISKRRVGLEDILGLGPREVETEANRCFNCGCVAVNPSDIAVALLALDASVKIVSPRRTRVIPIGDFFSSLRNVPEPDEVVTEIRIPRPVDGARQTFLKFRSRQAIDFATVSVASLITVRDGTCKEARIALGAVAPRLFRATEAEEKIKGKAINARVAEAAAAAAVRDAIPLKQNAYKVEIIKALVKRALLS
jgi:NADPH-dependent glutamate synthase beta subunit-like oxidoreductase/CO/xanthine dehydrogenase FAD-binding subunit